MFEDFKDFFDSIVERLAKQKPATQEVNGQQYALKADGR